MNFVDFFKHLGIVLGILTNDTITITTLMTTNGMSTHTSTPIILDTSTQYKSSQSPLSTKFITSPSPGMYETIDDLSATTNNSTTGFNETTPVNTTALFTNGTDVPTGTTPESNGTSPVPDSTADFNQTTTVNTTALPTNGTDVSTGSTHDGNGTSNATVETTPEGNVTTSATEDTTHDKNATSSATEETTRGTGGTSEATTHDSTQVAPTDKPSLSRGAVAGIIIGCLLAVAIITAAIVFVVKQRNVPEAQRLRV